MYSSEENSKLCLSTQTLIDINNILAITETVKTDWIMANTNIQCYINLIKIHIWIQSVK